MGNGVAKLTVCFTGGAAGRAAARRKNDVDMLISDPYDEGLGHSFCYVRPEPPLIPSSKVHSEESTTATAVFRSISGASVSANTSTPLSTSAAAFVEGSSTFSAAAFESSTSFAAVPLQLIPRSGPFSGPITERGFMSGPIAQGFLSGPLDRGSGLYSGPLEKGPTFSISFRRSFSHGGTRTRSLIHGLRQAISRTLARGQGSIVAPVKGVGSVKYQDNWVVNGSEKNNENFTVSGSLNLSSETSLDDVDSFESQNLQWAQGKAGEDRVHVVVSEEHGWVFVGIYDGFNGPDATDYLLSNLYPAVHKELKGLLWDDSKYDSLSNSSSIATFGSSDVSNSSSSEMEGSVACCSQCVDHDTCAYSSGDPGFGLNPKGDKRCRNRNGRLKENQKGWKCEWDRERLELDRRLKEQLNQNGLDNVKGVNHSDVLKALSQALKKTEEAYLEIADQMVMENPELALMGSCVLVMLMKGEDVYVMNVGDSRAVLARKMDPNFSYGKIDQDLERINEESMYDLDGFDGVRPTLSAFQLTMDHSTSVEEEVQRIRDEHPDDASSVVNDRVKGSLKVTRAFGAGFLKQPKWNDALLEMFRIDYVGNSPYISCLPSLCHHRLGPKDRFLILSSDGLYQYFTNEEAVSEVELFISLSPEGDPAQHLVEEVLFRAAKKAGMDFYELLEIPQGDRRKYHDDVSIIVISFEGRIWRSCL